MLSTPAWAFFTADSVALITLCGQMIDARKKASAVADSVEEVRVTAQMAVNNTHSVSNGAIPGIREDVRFIKSYVIQLGERVDNLEEKIAHDPAH